MEAKREYRDRDEVQVGVLDALVDRHEEGMTVLELRSHVDAEIDQLEGALGELKEANLIEVRDAGQRTVILPEDRVVPDPSQEPTSPTLLEAIRRRLPL